VGRNTYIWVQTADEVLAMVVWYIVRHLCWLTLSRLHCLLTSEVSTSYSYTYCCTHVLCCRSYSLYPPCGNELHKPLYTVTRGIITCSQKHLSFILLTWSKSKEINLKECSSTRNSLGSLFSLDIYVACL